MIEYFKEIPIDWQKLDELILEKKKCKEIAEIFGIHRITLTHKMTRKYGKCFCDYSSMILLEKNKEAILKRIMKYL